MNLKTGGMKHLGTASTISQSLKRAILNDPTMLSPFAIDSLRRDLKQTVRTSKSIILRRAV